MFSYSIRVFFLCSVRVNGHVALPPKIPRGPLSGVVVLCLFALREEGCFLEEIYC